MAEIDGAWDCVTQSPMGEQRSTLTVTSHGDGTFSGTNGGALGAVDVKDGRIEGDRIRFSMDIPIPFPMKLTCEASITGDAFTGQVTAGVFGSFPITGKRRS